MTAISTFDIAANLKLFLRRQRAGSKVFTFLDSNGDAYNVSGITWQLNIRQNPSATPVIQLTSGSGLTISANEITATVTEVQTAIALSASYHWELYDTTNKKTWIYGRLTVGNREPIDAENSATLTVNTEPDAISITVTGGSSSITSLDGGSL